MGEFESLMGRLSETAGTPYIYVREEEKAKALLHTAEQKKLAARAFLFAAENAEALSHLNAGDIGVGIARTSEGAAYFRDRLEQELAKLLPQAITNTLLQIRDTSEVVFPIATPAENPRVELAAKIREWAKGNPGFTNLCIEGIGGWSEIPHCRTRGPFDGDLDLSRLAEILDPAT